MTQSSSYCFSSNWPLRSAPFNFQRYSAGTQLSSPCPSILYAFLDVVWLGYPNGSEFLASSAREREESETKQLGVDDMSLRPSPERDPVRAVSALRPKHYLRSGPYLQPHLWTSRGLWDDGPEWDQYHFPTHIFLLLFHCMFENNILCEGPEVGEGKEMSGRQRNGLHPFHSTSHLAQHLSMLPARLSS